VKELCSKSIRIEEGHMPQVWEGSTGKGRSGRAKYQNEEHTE